MLTLDYIRDVQVYQNKNGYRFSVDALLLYSFVNLKRVSMIADLGAGSGIIGLLLAKKYPSASVMLIELQKSLAVLAEKNITLNNLKDRVSIANTDIKHLNAKLSESYVSRSQAGKYKSGLLPESFDLVVSNPPFRKPKTGLLSEGDERAIARHELKLPLQDLIKAGSLLLKHHGRLCIIHLPERLSEIIDVMRQHGMEPKRLRFVHSNISSEAKMALIEAVKGGRTGLKTERPLFIYNEDGSYTEEMEKLYAC
ncbi:MAG: tRNA1(Val) (adenine(37)-N6)-methyltransferase [Nitrospirae bacterium]|nr:tRNA1(Val) (adenine(37)-N6)-methyltransferase [Nitrospirota bacterium]MCL5977758.1 tRNA1(Val) (adenine(37)-N6)-methyltransferase [Nitrospirota bacterium]